MQEYLLLYILLAAIGRLYNKYRERHSSQYYRKTASIKYFSQRHKHLAPGSRVELRFLLACFPESLRETFIIKNQSGGWRLIHGPLKLRTVHLSDNTIIYECKVSVQNVFP
jgi:hypothetical protein